MRLNWNVIDCAIQTQEKTFVRLSVTQTIIYTKPISYNDIFKEICKTRGKYLLKSRYLWDFVKVEYWAVTFVILFIFVFQTLSDFSRSQNTMAVSLCCVWIWSSLLCLKLICLTIVCCRCLAVVTGRSWYRTRCGRHNSRPQEDLWIQCLPYS